MPSKILNAEALLAIQETEQILAKYDKGNRMPKAFSNACEMFATMDEEDEREGNGYEA